MKKLKQKMLNKIKESLGITALEIENEHLTRKLEIFEHRVAETHYMYKAFSDGVDNVENIKKHFEIGVDISPMGRDSWAVICCKGKQERITFTDLSGKNMEEISRFLKQFQLDERNMCTDSPYGMGRKMFKRNW